jgi:hypothetical protein
MTDSKNEDWRGLALHGGDDTWIGQVAEVYDEDEYSTGMPAVVAVRTGLLGLRVSFVPLRGVAERDGDTIRVPYSKDQVAAAPGNDQAREIDPDELRQINRHYGLEGIPRPGEAEAGSTRRLIRRHVTVTVVRSDDPEALADALPPEVSPAEIHAATESDENVVIVVTEKEVETRLPEDGEATEEGLS